MFGVLPRGDSHIKVTGVLVVSLGVYIADFGLTSGDSDGKSPYLFIPVSLRAVHKEIKKTPGH